MTLPANILIGHFFCGLVEIPASVFCRIGHFWANLQLQEWGSAVIFYQEPASLCLAAVHAACLITACSFMCDKRASLIK